MKNITRIISVIVCAIMILILCPITASADSSVIMFSNSNPTIGDKVSVTCRYTSDKTLYDFTGTVTFDPQKLQYVSGAESNLGSYVKVHPAMSGENGYTYTVVFSVKAEGRVAIGFTGVGSDGESEFKSSCSGVMNCTQKQEIKKPTEITSSTKSSSNTTTTPSAKKPKDDAAAPSDNANLVSLEFDKGTLDQVFSPEITKYVLKIDNDVDIINVKATASFGAYIVGDGEYKYSDDNKQIVITVKSQSRKISQTYTIDVLKEKQEEDETENIKDITVGGIKYTLISDITPDLIPTNYFATTVEYHKQEISAIKSKNNQHIICFLADKGNNIKYFEYINSQFVEFPYIKDDNILYIVMDIPSKYTTEYIYKLSTIKFNEKDAQSLLIDESVDNIRLIWTDNGEKEQMLRYDTEEQTIQRALDVNLDIYRYKGISCLTVGIIAIFGCIVTTVVVIVVSVTKKKRRMYNFSHSRH